MSWLPWRPHQRHADTPGTMATFELPSPSPPTVRAGRHPTYWCCLRRSWRCPYDAGRDNNHGATNATPPVGTTTPGKTQAREAHPRLAQRRICCATRTTGGYPGRNCPRDTAPQAGWSIIGPCSVPTQGCSQGTCPGRRPPQASGGRSGTSSAGPGNSPRNRATTGPGSLQGPGQHRGGRGLRTGQRAFCPAQHRSECLPAATKCGARCIPCDGCCHSYGSLFAGPTPCGSNCTSEEPGASPKPGRQGSAVSRCITCHCCPRMSPPPGPTQPKPKRHGLAYSRRRGDRCAKPSELGAPHQLGLTTPGKSGTGTDHQGPQSPQWQISDCTPETSTSRRRSGLRHHLQGRVPLVTRGVPQPRQRRPLKGALPHAAHGGATAFGYQPSWSSPWAVGGRLLCTGLASRDLLRLQKGVSCLSVSGLGLLSVLGCFPPCFRPWRGFRVCLLVGNFFSHLCACWPDVQPSHFCQTCAVFGVHSMHPHCIAWPSPPHRIDCWEALVRPVTSLGVLPSWHSAKLAELSQQFLDEKTGGGGCAWNDSTEPSTTHPPRGSCFAPCLTAGTDGGRLATRCVSCRYQQLGQRFRPECLRRRRRRGSALWHRHLPWRPSTLMRSSKTSRRPHRPHSHTHRFGPCLGHSIAHSFSNSVAHSHSSSVGWQIS